MSSLYLKKPKLTGAAFNGSYILKLSLLSMINQVNLKILLAGFFAGEAQKFDFQTVFPEASQLKTFPLFSTKRKGFFTIYNHVVPN